MSVNLLRTQMINLLRRVREQYLKEGNYRIYSLYALGEVLLVMMGILLAMQVDNWNQNRHENRTKLENIENIYFSLNEDIQLGSLILMVEFALRGEQYWIDYLSGNLPYHDSLLIYGYAIGLTAYLSPNNGFYESLKQKGMETIENKGLRMLLTIVYEQNYPEIQRAMAHYSERFEKDRITYFRKYFIQGESHGIHYGDQYLHIDHVLFNIDGLKNKGAMEADREFLDFVKMSNVFHKNVLGQLERALNNVDKAKSLVSNEMTFARYGSPRRQEVTLLLENYQNVDEVFVSGEFNNWRPDGTMIRTPKGWETSFDLFPGSYEYKFIIMRNDDPHDPVNWIMDPANPDSVYVPEIGTYNSLLIVSE